MDEWVIVSEAEIAAAMLGVRDHHDGLLLEGALTFAFHISLMYTFFDHLRLKDVMRSL